MQLGDGFPPGGGLWLLIEPVGPFKGAGGQLPFQGLQLLRRRPAVDGGVVQLESDSLLAQPWGAVAAGQVGQQIKPAPEGVDRCHGGGRIRRGRETDLSSMDDPSINSGFMDRYGPFQATSGPWIGSLKPCQRLRSCSKRQASTARYKSSGAGRMSYVNPSYSNRSRGVCIIRTFCYLYGRSRGAGAAPSR